MWQPQDGLLKQPPYQIEQSFNPSLINFHITQFKHHILQLQYDDPKKLWSNNHVLTSNIMLTMIIAKMYILTKLLN